MTESDGILYMKAKDISRKSEMSFLSYKKSTSKNSCPVCPQSPSDVLSEGQIGSIISPERNQEA